MSKEVEMQLGRVHSLAHPCSLALRRRHLLLL